METFGDVIVVHSPKLNPCWNYLSFLIFDKNKYIKTYCYHKPIQSIVGRLTKKLEKILLTIQLDNVQIQYIKLLFQRRIRTGNILSEWLLFTVQSEKWVLSEQFDGEFYLLLRKMWHLMTKDPWIPLNFTLVFISKPPKQYLIPSRSSSPSPIFSNGKLSNLSNTTTYGERDRNCAYLYK